METDMPHIDADLFELNGRYFIHVENEEVLDAFRMGLNRIMKLRESSYKASQARSTTSKGRYKAYVTLKKIPRQFPKEFLDPPVKPIYIETGPVIINEVKSVSQPVPKTCGKQVTPPKPSISLKSVVKPVTPPKPQIKPIKQSVPTSPSEHSREEEEEQETLVPVIHRTCHCEHCIHHR